MRTCAFGTVSMRVTLILYLPMGSHLGAVNERAVTAFFTSCDRAPARCGVRVEWPDQTDASFLHTACLTIGKNKELRYCERLLNRRMIAQKRCSRSRSGCVTARTRWPNTGPSCGPSMRRPCGCGRYDWRATRGGSLNPV